MKKVDCSRISLHEGRRPFDIDWGLFQLNPLVELVSLLHRPRHRFERVETGDRLHVLFRGGDFELSGTWDESPGFASLLSLRLSYRGAEPVTLARLSFLAENGLRRFLGDIDPRNISFLRNGYQSWSTTRSYRMVDRPFRPRFKFVSLASSNMANLPSNKPGRYASEMYALTADLARGESFFVGQGAPFNQFFYIRLALDPRKRGEHYLELVYDFGRKVMQPGETIDLDGILLGRGVTGELPGRYFEYLRDRLGLRLPGKGPRGWSSWYYYYNRITPADILENLAVIRDRSLPVDCVQIDDGWQSVVGDWLELSAPFQGRMAELAGKIREAGKLPGLWLAPFVAASKSRLVREHPEFLLRDSLGRPLAAGLNVFWPGYRYYGIDITRPEVQDYIRTVIRTVVHEWGFGLLKLDFLFGAALRGAVFHDRSLTRAQVLKLGMRIIREEAGPEAFLIGCGMPLSAGIGTVEAMRVGSDTGPYWWSFLGTILRTSAMTDARNSLRNFVVRSAMNRRLWINDPDCLSLRPTRTSLTVNERRTIANAVILSGGLVFFSDRLSELPDHAFGEMERISALAMRCAGGYAIPLDLMEREMPELYTNTAGLFGIFNFTDRTVSRKVPLRDLLTVPAGKRPVAIRDVWSGERIPLPENPVIVIGDFAPHASRLFEVLTE